jgi:hypothetical protein
MLLTSDTVLSDGKLKTVEFPASVLKLNVTLLKYSRRKAELLFLTMREFSINRLALLAFTYKNEPSVLASFSLKLDCPIYTVCKALLDR